MLTSLHIAKFRNLKGVVLAAGRGQRMQPFTNTTPKPLLSFAGVPILYLALWRLHQAGVYEIKVNAHHLWERIETAIEQCPLPLNLSISHEKQQLLGTAGAYKKLEGWRQGSAIISINGDIVSDINLQALIHFHNQRQPLATMLLLPHTNPKETKIWCQNDRVIAIGGDRPAFKNVSAHTFGCAQILSDQFLKRIPASYPSEIVPIYQEALAKGEKIGAQIQNNFWFDLGLPSRFLNAHQTLIQEAGYFASMSRSLGLTSLAGNNLCYFPKGKHSFRSATIEGPALISNAAEIGSRVTIGPHTIINEHATVKKGSRLHGSVLLENASIPSHSDLRNCLADQKNLLELKT